MAARYADREPSPWPEARLYERFVTDADARACQTWHQLPWKQRVAFAAEAIADERLRAFANRLAFLEAPHLLSPAAWQRGRAWLAHRLTTAEEVPWLTLESAIRRCVVLRAEINDPEVQARLDEIVAWLSARSQLAAEAA